VTIKQNPLNLLSTEDKLCGACLTVLVLTCSLYPPAASLFPGSLLLLISGLGSKLLSWYSPADFKSSERVNYTWLLGCAAVLASLLVIHFPLREFYYDSSAQIDIGAATRQANFLVTHGQRSGAGIPNPPLFAYVMGVITFFTQDPKIITAFFAVTTFLSLLVFVWNLSSVVNAFTTHVLAALIAVSPGILFYTNLLWEGSLIFMGMSVFFVCLVRYLQGRSGWYFVGAGIVATLIAQSHKSGFFLYPVLLVIWIATCRTLGWKKLLLTALLVGGLSIPYALFVVSELGTSSLSGSGEPSSLVHPGTIVMVFAGTFSLFHNHYTYFDRGFSDLLPRAAGPFGAPLYGLSIIIAVNFLLGWMGYLVHVVRFRKLFTRNEDSNTSFPLAFQLSGLMVTVIFLGYAFTLPYIWFKHALILFPSYFILAAWSFQTLWTYRLARWVLMACVLSSLVLSILLYRILDRAGGSIGRGAIQDYQLSYQSLESIRDEVEALLPPNTSPVLYTSGYWEGPIRTVVLNPLQTSSTSTTPFFIQLKWQASEYRYTWEVRPISIAAKRHQEAQNNFVRDWKPGKSVTVSKEILHRIPLSSELPEFQPTHSLIPDQVETHFYVRGKEPTTDVVVLDTSIPWSKPTTTTADVLALLATGRFTLNHNYNGIYVLVRAEDSASNVAPPTLHFPLLESLAFSKTGTLIEDPQAHFGMSRKAHEQDDGKGFLTYGPYLDLPPGRHKVTFRYQVNDSTNQPAIKLEVTSNGGQKILSEHLVNEDTPEDIWSEKDLFFTAGPQGVQQTEFRIYYFGNGNVNVDTPTLTLTPTENVSPSE